ncbi:hypothetical protein AKJ09_05819 [Labilithrix luteola]|uniref:DUF1579 domain-containing protein n=1 Tax=Labilithrix luteola TaxID=1391654 RepID=A0A0K1Q045_9BACT|nr:hypothetical protein AKJ09_05819 [Labilithrix luteola]
MRRLTGAWSARIKHYERPNQPPRESSGEFLARMDIGGLFLCREVNFGMAGFQGRGITGYDASRGTYVGTWVDSTSPLIYRTEGHFDARGVYCEHSEVPSANGASNRLRLTTEVIAPNQMLLRIYEPDEVGNETLVIQIEHTRRRFID